MHLWPRGGSAALKSGAPTLGQARFLSFGDLARIIHDICGAYRKGQGGMEHDFNMPDGAGNSL